jgi:neutral ceramidase
MRSTPAILLLPTIAFVSIVSAEPSQGAPSGPTPFRAGIASRVITPDVPMWMAGYGNRDHPSEGTQHDLTINALALEDSAGTALVLVTCDLIGIPREFGEKVAAEVKSRAGIPRERLMLTSSHTHCGPVLDGNLMDMYPMPAAQKAQVARYTDRLAGTTVETILAALADRRLARLSYGTGTARFAMNRRQPTANGFINGRNPDGPVDHSVPVLKVEGTDGSLRAAVFGYACHNTTLSYYRWCGDYAGFAQREFESKHPGAVAMFWSGCGADANPLPRGTVEHAQRYGRELAEAVEGVVAKSMTPFAGTFAARYSTIPLAFDHTPKREELVADIQDKKNHTKRQRAERFLKMLDAGRSIPAEYSSYPVQAWRCGDGPLWISLGGEVVVDYALRLKKELAGERPVWVTGYANDVMAYIPSERVLKEGGYEGDTSMLPYGQPSKWQAGLEEKIVGKVKELAQQVR